jgi:chorismate-pyruvate lyase
MGTVFFWIYALIGVVVVIATYIVFDNVLWAEEDSLSAALIPLGLNMSAQPIVTLQSMWGLWAPAFVIAWGLALIIKSITREPDIGMR